MPLHELIGPHFRLFIRGEIPEGLEQRVLFVGAHVVLEEGGDLSDQIQVDSHTGILGEEPPGCIRMRVHSFLDYGVLLFQGAAWCTERYGVQLRHEEHEVHGLKKPRWSLSPQPVLFGVEDIRVGCEVQQGLDIVRTRWLSIC